MKKDPFTPPIVKCETCRYFAGETCRRYAPRQIIWPSDWVWPDVGPDDWCGEWSEAIDR